MGKRTERAAVVGGGTATSVVILFQQQFGAVIAIQQLADRPLDPMLKLKRAKPVWKRLKNFICVCAGTASDSGCWFQRIDLGFISDRFVVMSRFMSMMASTT